MYHSVTAVLFSLLTYTNAFPLPNFLPNFFATKDSPSSPILPRQDDTVDVASSYLSSPGPIAISNSIPSIICSTTADTSRYSSFDITNTIELSAGDILDRYPGDTADPSQSDPTSVFTLTDGPNLSTAQADPALPPTFAQGCDASKAMFWAPMASLRGTHPVDIGVFNVERKPDGSDTAIATFCGVMTNSDRVAKNKYQLCNADLERLVFGLGNRNKG
ncbi:MAG: hypothetical protein Q9210_001956 [Variospora velana]